MLLTLLPLSMSTRLFVSNLGAEMEIRTSMGYVSIALGPGRAIEARLRGRRANGSELGRVLRTLGIPEREARKVASMVRHPSTAATDEHRPADRRSMENALQRPLWERRIDRPDRRAARRGEFQPDARVSDN